MQKINQKYIKAIVKQALLEDLRPRGDITTKFLKNKNKIAIAKIISKQNGVIAGIDFCKNTFLVLDKKTKFKKKIKDGSNIKKGKQLQLCLQKLNLF